jgi:hypothetical protein
MTKEIYDAVSDSVSTERALDLALEALATEEYRLRQTGQSQVYPGIGFAITAIKQARSAPVQEPVAWTNWRELAGARHYRTPGWEMYADKRNFEDVPLYTTPPAAQRQWVGLTEDEIRKLAKENIFVLNAIIATNAKLKEKNESHRQHVTDGSPCWCEPETSYTDPETGASVIVHKEPQ